MFQVSASNLLHYTIFRFFNILYLFSFELKKFQDIKSIKNTSEFLSKVSDFAENAVKNTFFFLFSKKHSYKVLEINIYFFNPHDQLQLLQSQPAIAIMMYKKMKK